LRVDWYAANPGFHEIPPGYGLPWGTREEEYIPAPLVFESEFALARRSSKRKHRCAIRRRSSRPPRRRKKLPPPVMLKSTSDLPVGNNNGKDATKGKRGTSSNMPSSKSPPSKSAVRENTHAIRALYEEGATSEELPPGDSTAPKPAASLPSEPAAVAGTTGAISVHGLHGAPVLLPANWPDKRDFIPPPPNLERPLCCPFNGPVMTHTRIYHATTANSRRRSPATITSEMTPASAAGKTTCNAATTSFASAVTCNLCEMLSARGGAGETRVVWQWSDCR